MKQIFISENIPEPIEDFLITEGFILRKLRSCNSLSLPVSSHADMLIFSDGRRMITTKEYYENNKEIFASCDITAADITLGNRYPQDVALNCFVAGDRLYGRLESVCDNIRNLYLKQTNLSQGYAKCSTLLFGNNAITADEGIASALAFNGTNVLRISPGKILLPGYDYGFIGGASFVYGRNIIFFGDITAHPDFTMIRSFIENSGYSITYTDTHPLIDLGGAVTFE